jgi:predicted metal-dependent peptidase
MNGERLAKIIKTMMLKYPFYGLYASTLNKKFTKDIKTLAVAKNGIFCELLINPDYLESLPEDLQENALIHELLHICFEHPYIAKEYPNKKAFNYAVDLEVNSYLDKIKDDWVSVNSPEFKHLNLSPKMGTKYYYPIMVQELKNNPSLGDKYRDNDWNGFDDLDEATEKLEREQLRFTLENVAEEIKKSCGSVPGFVEELLKSFQLKKPKFDWKSYVRKFVGFTINYNIKRSRSKVNKRFEENPGLKLQRKKHIMVAIDTSGSVSLEELKEFMNEINHIHKTGSDVTVVQADTRINSIKKFNPKEEIKIAGRGGTSFEEVLEHFNESKDYTVGIYFTDGECNTNQKIKKPFLWVLSSKSQDNSTLPGKRIILPK